jgi:carbamoyltransferase
VIVLGLNAFHPDSAAALVIDGAVVAAAEEERFRRVKHWAGFPSEAIRFCLAFAGVSPEAIDAVAVNTHPRVALWPRATHALRYPPSPALVLEKLRNRRRRRSALALLAQVFPDTHLRARLAHVPHHTAHLASAFFVSPFDHAQVVSVDGFGDFASAAWGVGRAATLDVQGHIYFPHSLGAFYQSMTQYLGFPAYGDEYKVMGLAPYGEATFVEALRRVLKTSPSGRFALDPKYFRFHRERTAYEWDNAAPAFDPMFSAELERLLGPARRPDEEISQRHKDLAHSIQVVYEDAFLNLLRALHAKSGETALALAGGCAQNSVANGRITTSTPYRDVYVAAAGYDAGGALGAALSVWAQESGRRPLPLQHAYLGPAASEGSVAALLRDRSIDLAGAGCQVQHLPDDRALFETTAARIASGDVVGWFQGRMEWGPRALGARSILCDPRRADMKALLNRKIKRRESFRPFAPSVLREHVASWFELDADVPFMSQVFPIRAEKRPLVPAVTHVDGTGRLQTVTEVASPRYYALISAFHRTTGVPMVLNTSFNESEPIVCLPEEALACFLRTNMDVLVIENWMLTRTAKG